MPAKKTKTEKKPKKAVNTRVTVVFNKAAAKFIADLPWGEKGAFVNEAVEKHMTKYKPKK